MGVDAAALRAMTATETAAAIASGTVSATDAVEASLSRIDELDGELNAVCVRLDDQAREAASAADAKKAAGEPLGPLHGVPMTIKEGIDIAGTPSTWGFADRANHSADHDATVVSRLKAAGAICVGKTNVPVALADWQSNNPVYGRTRNPWDTDRTPGGSSGGSAVSLAAGYVSVEVGSDIGGSLRDPAHFCGVTAHKPTYGIVPLTGHALDTNLRPVDLSVVGPMARSAADLPMLLDLMAGPDGSEATGYRLELPPPRRGSLFGLRVAVVTEESVCAVSPDVQASIRAAADAAAEQGAHVETVTLPVDTAYSHDVYIRLLRSAIPAGHSAADAEKIRAQALREATSPNTTTWRTRVNLASTMPHSEWMAADLERSELRRAWAAFFDQYDVVLCPAAPTPAWPHDDADRFDRTIDIGDSRTIGYYEQLFWAGISTLVYLPSTVIAGAPNESGLPIGLQLIGPHFGDRTTMQAAISLESALSAAGTGGYRAPLP